MPEDASPNPLPLRFAALFNVRREEILPVLLAGLFFFCVLTALMVLRPARDALGMQRGIEAVRWLFIGTAVITLLANPAFGWLVSRFRRLQFIAATYIFFALSLVGFHLLLVLAWAVLGLWLGRAQQRLASDRESAFPAALDNIPGEPPPTRSLS